MFTRSRAVSGLVWGVVTTVVVGGSAVAVGAVLLLELPQPVAANTATATHAPISGGEHLTSAFILGSPKIVKPVSPSVLDLFLELAAIPSPSGRERPVADRVGAYLSELGLAWDEDDSGPSVGSDAGNIFCRLPGRDPAGTPLFFCAHL